MDRIVRRPRASDPPSTVELVDQRVDAFRAPDGRRVAFGVVGSGPPLVFAPWWVSHLERHWLDGDTRAFLVGLAERHTVIRYDRPGVGLSDRDRGPLDLATELAYLRALVDHLELDEFDLAGVSCGAPPAVALSAEQPERVRQLVVFGGYADGAQIGTLEARTAFVAFIRSNWGLGSKTMSDLFDPGASAEDARRSAEDQRQCASAEMAAELLQLTYDMNVTDVAGHVVCPSLVLHRRRDRAIKAVLGEQLAALIPHARLELLEGDEHLPWAGDSLDARERIESFLTGWSPAPSSTRRLATLLFTDMVDSTVAAGERGDRRWRRVLDSHQAELDRLLSDHDGRLVKDTGDGALAEFSLPSAAIRCADAIRRAMLRHGIEMRAGVHTGEIEERDRDVAGLGVHVAARIEQLATPGDILVSSTAKELASGAGFLFTDLGEHQLKGVQDRWRVYRYDG